MFWFRSALLKQATVGFLLLVSCSDDGENSGKRSNEDVQAEHADPKVLQKETDSVSAKETTENNGPLVTDQLDKVIQRTPCVLSAPIPKVAMTMEKIVETINKLPKPVSIPCLIDVLPRPLKINATSSDLSVQPADGVSNPRIFISIDSVLLTFTLGGEGSDSLEFSHLISDLRSVKGEIIFPVNENLASSAAYQGVLRDNFAGTRCAACHFEEAGAVSPFPDVAYSSKALRPFERQNITLESLKKLFETCKDTTSHRCDLLESIYRGADPQPYLFPASMGTLF